MKLAMAQMSMSGNMDENLKRSLAFCDAAAEGVAVTGNVTRAVESATGGSMYTIVLTASGEGFAPLTLTAYRYLPGEGAAQ